jgi:uncharacterized phage protein gp47/JayE
MPFQIPSLSATRQFIAALGKALFPGLNFGSTRSYHGKWTTFLSGAVTQLHFHADSAQQDLHPLTAGDGKPINDWGSAVGVERKGATPARKSAAGRVRGGAGKTVSAGLQLQHPQSGLLFEIANPTDLTIPGVSGVDPDSFVDADIVGVDTGSQTRLEAGQDLVFLSTPIGLESTVNLVKSLDEDGFDDEQFGSYRSRVLGTFSNTPSGGSASDFVGWVEASVPAIKTGYAFPNRNGRGTIDLVGFYAGSGTSRSLSDADKNAMLAYVRTKAPFQVAGDGGGLRALTTVADPQTVELLITTTGVPAYAFDWPGSGLVQSYNATTRELQFQGGALPASLQAGHRMILVGTVGGSGVTAQDGREYMIESISAVDKVILQDAPPVSPANGDLIYPGGPLVTPIRDAIVGHISGEIVYSGRGGTPIPESSAQPADPNGPSVIGLDVLAEPMGPANPDGKYGNWAGGIVLVTLFKIAGYKAGVRNVQITSPATDYEPLDDPFPTNDQIHYVTPAVVIVRSA